MRWRLVDRLIACDPGRSAAESFVDAAVDRGFQLQVRDADGTEVAGLKLGEFRLLCLTR